MKLAISLILLCTLYPVLCTNCAAVAVTSQELLGHPEKYDGEMITFKGEVIGDVLVRGEWAWINVRDEYQAIGVFCPRQLTENFVHLGDYRFSGDLVTVHGKFRHFCPEHGGDTDIHANKISLIQPGQKLAHPLEPEKIRMAVILSSLALGLAITHLLTRRL